ncbi:MAG: type II secretion system GspH family protein, partial [Oscillospiraceae bacterium]|nr:type II secretion system GspH family protein [Oscillospiraceae bacterium]
MKRIKRTAGFTLIEIIAVLVIIGIMVAIAVPSVAAYLRMGYQTNRMSIARTIFLAAQNQLTEKRITGELTEKGEYGKKAECRNVYQKLEKAYNNDLPEGMWSDIEGDYGIDEATGKALTNKDVVQYISKPKNDENYLLDLEGDLVYKLLSPVIIDKSLLNNAILIEYNIKTGKVLSVFYSDTAMEAGVSWDYEETGGSQSVYGNRGRNEFAYQYSDERSQGYYGVGTTGTLNDPLPESHASLHDAAGTQGDDILKELELNVDNALYARFLIADGAIGQTFQVALGNKNEEPLYDPPVDFEGLKDRGISEFDTLPNGDQLFYNGLYDSSGSKYHEFIWVVDYVHGDTRPGGNSYTVFSSDDYSLEGVTARIIMNGVEQRESIPQRPYYAQRDANIIESARHLYNIRYNPEKSYIQLTDIIMTAGGDGGVSNFLPIPSFSGSYDGRDYNGNKCTITNLKVDTSGNAGLFAVNDGIIENVTFVDAKITGGEYVGVVAGRSSRKISGITINGGTVTGTGDNVGGVVGSSSGEISGIGVKDSTVSGDNSVGGVAGETTGIGGTIHSIYIENMTIKGTYSASSNIGGVVGFARGAVGNTEITNSIDVKNVRIYNDKGGSLLYAGGVAGAVSRTASISNAVATGLDIDGNNNIGGIAGSTNGPISNVSVYNSNISGTVEYIGGITGNAGDSRSIIDGAIVQNSIIEGTFTTNRFIGGIAGKSITAVRNTTFISSEESEESEALVPVKAVSTSDSVGGIIGSLSSTGTISNVLYLALAPKNADGKIIPITPMDGIYPSVFYLAGKPNRPIPDPKERDGYNQEASVGPGLPLNTEEMYIGDHMGDVWSAPPEGIDPLNKENPTFPYPYVTALAEHRPAHDKWPIAGPDTETKLFYAEWHGNADNSTKQPYDFYPFGGTDKILDPTSGSFVTHDSYGIQVADFTDGKDYTLLLGSADYTVRIQVSGKKVTVKGEADWPFEFEGDTVRIFIPNSIAEGTSSGGDTSITFGGIEAGTFNPLFASTGDIRSPRHIDNIDKGNLDKNFIQKLDIDFGSYHRELTGSDTTLGFSHDTETSHMASLKTSPVTGLFTGSYDGNGKTIRRLTVNHPSGDNLGLFSIFEPTENSNAINDLIFENATITGRNNVGVVAGSSSGEISGIVLNNSTVTGTGDNAGGVAGSSNGEISGINITGTLNGANSTTTITGNNFVGGIAGTGETGSQFYNIHVYGIAVQGADTADNNIGGVVGWLKGSLSDVTVDNVKISITISGSNIGGVAGTSRQYSTINKVLVKNSTVEGQNNVGGIVGQSGGNVQNATFVHAGAEVPVKGNNGVGGIVGNRTNGAINNVLYLALAPIRETTKEIIPITPDNAAAVTNAYYLSGKPKWPPSVPDEDYNPEEQVIGPGAGYDTWSFYDLFNKADGYPLTPDWEKHIGLIKEVILDPLNPDNDTYPYPFANALAEHMLEIVNWPIVENIEKVTAEVFYAEWHNGVDEPYYDDGLTSSITNEGIVTHDSYGIKVVGITGDRTYTLTLGSVDYEVSAA